MYKHLLLLTCAAGALGISAGAANAATASASATDQSATNVTEIVVTAEKREQSLQKVPVAVSVFTGAQRDTIGISSVVEVTNFAPGFTYDPGNVHAFIRGVGRQSVNVTDDQRVANYENEFYVYSPYNLSLSSLFLTREQIERGPQNVGGRNAAAGSIDMISVRPTDEPYAEIRGTVSNFGFHEVEAAMSGTVAPNLTARIAGFSQNQDFGFYKNVLGGPDEGNVTHEWYVEGQLDWKPSDKAEFWTRGFFKAWDGRADAGSRLGYHTGSWNETTFSDANAYVAGGLFVNPNYGFSAPNGNPTAFAAVQNHNLAVFAANAASATPNACPLCLVDPIVTSVTLYRPGILNNPSQADHNLFAAPTPSSVKLNNYADFNYILTLHFDTFDFKYTGGVQGYNYYRLYPGDGPDGETNVQSFTLFALPGVTPLTVNPLVQSNYVEDDWWSDHDFTFQSTTDSALQWTGGVFYFRQRYNQPYNAYDPLQPQLTHPVCVVAGFCGIAGAAAPANPHNDFGYFDYLFNVETVSPYGQISYKINDQFKITGDLRYTFDRKWGTETTRYISFPAALGTAIPIPGVGSFPLYSVLGANSPSVDVTAAVICSTGTATVGLPANNLQNPACTTGPLASGVLNKGVILPNGYAQRQLGIDTGAMTGGVNLGWQPTSDIFAYARYGRGYESPSFNAGQVIAAPASKSEYLNAYEIGYKQAFGKQLLIDLAAFYYDYEDLQTPFAISNGGVTQNLFINVPKSVSEGVELEAYWTPINDLLVTTSYSFDHTAVRTKCTGTFNAAGIFIPATNALCLLDTNDPSAVQPGARPFPGQVAASKVQSVDGNPLPNAPENKFAIDVAYTWHFDPGTLTLSGTFVWRDTQSSALFDRFYNVAPSWNDLDFRVVWKGDKDKYEVIGFVKNATDSLQYPVGYAGSGLGGSATAITPQATGFNEVSSVQLNPPRTYGLELRYKFF
jgi:iron complex outermembrane receptor protein